VNDNLGSPAAADTVLGVERLQPLFHLLNGDLCYANLAEDWVRTWWDFWENNSCSARSRLWMPAAGNHENELGNGPAGYRAYQTYFSLPDAPSHTDMTRGLWYAFTVGSVRVISVANDDVCTKTAATPMSAAIRRARRWRGWKGNSPPPVATATATGSSSACTRWRYPRSTSSTAQISAFARNGCHCSINTAPTSWSAGMITIRAFAPDPRRAAERDADPGSHGDRQ
jgi:hypothetical protein